MRCVVLPPLPDQFCCHDKKQTSTFNQEMPCVLSDAHVLLCLNVVIVVVAYVLAVLHVQVNYK